MDRPAVRPVDLAKLEPAPFVAPQWSNLKPRAGFAPESRAVLGKQPLITYKFMKPTPQISPNHTGFPLTDCNYQPTADGKIAAGKKITKLTGLHKLSSDFIGREMVRDYAIQFAAFTFIALISAWPIYLSIVAIGKMLRVW
jgi:hypothetical protein